MTGFYVGSVRVITEHYYITKKQKELISKLRKLTQNYINKVTRT